MNFEGGDKFKSEAQANKKWAEEKEIPENEIKSKFIDSNIFEEVIDEFLKDEIFKQERSEIMEEVKNQISNKQKPQNDPYIGQEKWDQGLAETVKDIINQEIKKRS